MINGVNIMSDISENNNLSPLEKTVGNKVTERHSCLVIHYDNINTSEMKIGKKTMKLLVKHFPAI